MKHHSKLYILLFSLFLIFNLTGCNLQNAKLSEAFDEDTLTAEAMKAIGYFNERDYQSIIDMGNEDLKAAITVEEFAKQSDPYLDQDGSFREISKTVVLGSKNPETGENYGCLVMIGNYEKGKIQFVIGFNENMELIQFVIK